MDFQTIATVDDRDSIGASHLADARISLNQTKALAVKYLRAAGIELDIELNLDEPRGLEYRFFGRALIDGLPVHDSGIAIEIGANTGRLTKLVPDFGTRNVEPPEVASSSSPSISPVQAVLSAAAVAGESGLTGVRLISEPELGWVTPWVSSTQKLGNPTPSEGNDLDLHRVRLAYRVFMESAQDAEHRSYRRVLYVSAEDGHILRGSEGASNGGFGHSATTSALLTEPGQIKLFATNGTVSCINTRLTPAGKIKVTERLPLVLMEVNGTKVVMGWNAALRRLTLGSSGDVFSYSPSAELLQALDRAIKE